MQHYQLPQEKVKHFVVVIGTIFLLTINMCDRGRTITHLQIPRFHTQVWYSTIFHTIPEWNSLSAAAAEAGSITSFKSQLASLSP